MSKKYSSNICDWCYHNWYLNNGPCYKGGIYSSRDVIRWAEQKVFQSEYIAKISKDCPGCSDTYKLKVRVLGNLLYKLGVKSWT
jgi:hypothetical protein